jgi:D-arabinose 1-dehydrogenase-like Zn-dependent alcohol dehydrogenase
MPSRIAAASALIVSVRGNIGSNAPIPSRSRSSRTRTVVQALPSAGLHRIRLIVTANSRSGNWLRRGGRACLAGWLGGLAPIKDFNPLLQMASGVYLTFFGSFVFGTPGFPLSDVPLQEIAQQVAAGKLKAEPARVFGFEEILEAHRVMEAGEAGGKMVVVLG